MKSIWGVLLLLPGWASAQPVLVRGDVDGAGVRALTRAARACGGAVPRVSEPARPEAPAPAAEAVQAVSRARQLTLDAEFEQAIAALQGLYLALANEPARAGTGRVWAEALTVDAYARWSRAGAPDEVPSDVAARLDEAVSLWPDVQVEQSVMPPPVVRALEAARARRARRASGEVAIVDARGATWAWVSGNPEEARTVLRPAGRTLVAVVDAWGRTRVQLVDIQPATRVDAPIGGARRPLSQSPPPGARGAVVVGQGAEGVTAQQWPEGRARVDVARTSAALARRLGLCEGGAVADDTGDAARPGAHRGGGSAALWYVLGAAVVVAGGATLGVLLTSDPVAEIRVHTGP